MTPEKVIELGEKAGINIGAWIVQCSLEELQAFAQLVRNEALAEPARTSQDVCTEPVTTIPLKDGKYLKLEPFYFLGPVCWVLYTADHKQIRALDEYESGFVNAALNAAPVREPVAEPAPTMEPLGTEFAAVLHKNLWELYETEPAPEPVTDGESYDDLFNALHRIDSASHRLPTFEVKHQGGLSAFVQNIVDAIEASAAPVREPVPMLTYEEISSEASRHWAEDGVDPIEFARVIEALVRQKAGL